MPLKLRFAVSRLQDTGHCPADLRAIIALSSSTVTCVCQIILIDTRGRLCRWKGLQISNGRILCTVCIPSKCGHSRAGWPTIQIPLLMRVAVQQHLQDTTLAPPSLRIPLKVSLAGYHCCDVQMKCSRNFAVRCGEGFCIKYSSKTYSRTFHHSFSDKPQLLHCQIMQLYSAHIVDMD